MGVVELTVDAARKRQLETYADELEKLCEPYTAVFSQGEASDRVLMDLAKATGYFDILPDTATEAELRAHNARRAIFERIINLAEVNGARIAALRHRAAVAGASQIPGSTGR